MTLSMHPMTLVDFEGLLDEKGPNISQWPETFRKDAEMLVNSTPEAQYLLAEAQAVDTLLKNAPMVKAPSGLANRIMSKAVVSATSSNAPSGRKVY